MLRRARRAAIARTGFPEVLSASVDFQTVKRVARLARIAVSDDDAERMTGELNVILGFVEQLNEVDVTGVEPMTSVTPMDMKKRQDAVTDGNKAGDIVANAPATEARTSSWCRRWWRHVLVAVEIAIETPLQDDVRVAALNATMILADTARIPVPVDRRADGRPGHHSVRRPRRRQAGRHGRAEGPWRRARRSEAHVHAAGGARPACRLADPATDRGAGAVQGYFAAGAGNRRSGWLRAAYRVYERGGFTRCGVVLDYPDSGFSRFYEKKLSQ